MIYYKSISFREFQQFRGEPSSNLMALEVLRQIQNCPKVRGRASDGNKQSQNRKTLSLRHIHVLILFTGKRKCPGRVRARKGEELDCWDLFQFKITWNLPRKWGRRQKSFSEGYISISGISLMATGPKGTWYPIIPGLSITEFLDYKIKRVMRTNMGVQSYHLSHLNKECPLNLSMRIFLELFLF